MLDLLFERMNPHLEKNQFICGESFSIADITGHTIFETSDHKLLMHIGHPEYAASRFAEEAIRDKDNPNVPNVANFDYNNPINSWRMHRNIFFQQWINFCYKSIS